VTTTPQGSSSVRSASSTGSGNGAVHERVGRGGGPGTVSGVPLVAYVAIATLIEANPFADALPNGGDP
jgi:hypothetical protein